MKATMSRREVLKTSGAIAVTVAATGGAIGVAGCDVNKWIDVALADLPTIIQVVTSIASIVAAAQGGTVPQIVINQINEYSAEAKTALETAKAVVATYQTLSGSARADALGKIDAALNTAIQNMNSILTVFHVGDPTLQATISAAVGSAITVVLAIEALVPPPPVTPSPAHRKLHLSAKSNGNDVIKEAFNTIVGKAYPQAVIQ